MQLYGRIGNNDQSNGLNEYYHEKESAEIAKIYPDGIHGWFAGGAVFRSGCTFTRGYGRIFYFQPGHEEYPVYRIPEIQQIIQNAVRWCCNEDRKQEELTCCHID